MPGLAKAVPRHPTCLLVLVCTLSLRVFCPLSAPSYHQNAVANVVEVYADPYCHFSRLMGLDLEAPSGQGPRCHRYAGIVDDGILLSLKVERSPGELQVSDAQSMLNEWKEFFPV